VIICGVSSVLGMSHSKEYEDFAMRNLIILVGIQKEFIKYLKKQANMGEGKPYFGVGTMNFCF
jgi:hypothetical protein